MIIDQTQRSLTGTVVAWQSYVENALTLPPVCHPGTQTMQGSATSAPHLQGATIGGIGPQDVDATVIQGVNTSGTVRVNNLANLEALINVVANLIQVIGFSLSAFLLSESIVNKGLHAPVRLSRFRTAILASIVAALAISAPGMVNLVISWMRDCSLFC